MTLEEIAVQLEPLALRLVAVEDENLEQDACLAKAMICFIMGLSDQVSEEQRPKVVKSAIIALAPLFVELESAPTRAAQDEEPDGSKEELV